VAGITYRSLVGLENLTSVEGDLRIANSAALDSLSALQNLTVVGGQLTIESTAVPTLSGLENITSVGGELGIILNASLTRLGPLHDWPADAVSGVITIAFNPQLPECEPLAFDASQTGAACTGSSCINNEGTGTCP
jgi:hypothetical protein